MTQLAIAASNIGRFLGGIDRGLDCYRAHLPGHRAIAPGRAPVSAQFTLDALIGIAPFLLSAIAIAAYAKATGADGHGAGVPSRLSMMILCRRIRGPVSLLFVRRDSVRRSALVYGYPGARRDGLLAGVAVDGPIKICPATGCWALTSPSC